MTITTKELTSNNLKQNNAYVSPYAFVLCSPPYFNPYAVTLPFNDPVETPVLLVTPSLPEPPPPLPPSLPSMLLAKSRTFRTLFLQTAFTQILASAEKALLDVDPDNAKELTEKLGGWLGAANLLQQSVPEELRLSLKSCLSAVEVIAKAIQSQVDKNVV